MAGIIIEGQNPAIHFAILEFGRKMYSSEEDTTDDTYSAQFGQKGSAFALSLVNVGSVVMTGYFLDKYADLMPYFVASISASALLLHASFSYGNKASKKNANNVAGLSLLIYVVNSLALIIAIG